MPNALITGASRGLGRALAATLAGRGWGLVIDARGAGELEEARREIDRRGTLVARAGDVADAWHRDELRWAAAGMGGLDALVLNASTLGPSPRPALDRYPVEELRRVIEVNAIAPLALLQELLPALRPGARVVAVTSDAGREHYAGWGGYGASKAALELMFGVLGMEHPELSVLVVDPGDMRTRMHQEAFPDEDIGDRPPPGERVPALVRLLEAGAPSGRYELAAEAVAS
jgi:NAD(P)-dependent dehydrogenase (short-subunit alcohol dehydrogenase family)